MAYNTRGSRRIQVSGLSFRWRVSPFQRQLVVWHVLDAGTLTVQYGVPSFVPTPAFVSAVVRQALSDQWDTRLHRQLILDRLDLQRLTGLAPTTRPWTRDIHALVAEQAGLLEAPSLDAVGSTGLQVVYVPSARSRVLTAWIDGSRAFVQLHTAGEDGIRTWRASTDRDALQDCIVGTLAVPLGTTDDPQVCLLGVRVRTPTATESFSGRPDSLDSALVVAGLGLWRLAMAAFEPERRAREAIEELHPYIQPGTLPLARGDHRLRLFGDWDGSLVDAFTEVLASCNGPWVVDATAVRHVSPVFPNRLAPVLRERVAPLFWVARPDHPWVWPTFESRARAWRAYEAAHEPVVQGLLNTLDVRWRGVARDALTRGGPERLADLPRWVGPSWEVGEGPTEGFRPRDGWRWRQRGRGLTVGYDSAVYDDGGVRLTTVISP